MPRLQSMDVTIRGVTRNFVFDPPEDFGEGDVGTISINALEEAETTEVMLVNSMASARVEVSFTVTGTAEFDLEQLDEYADVSDLRAGIERGDFSEVQDTILDEAHNGTVYSFDIDSLIVRDEDGRELDE